MSAKRPRNHSHTQVHDHRVSTALHGQSVLHRFIPLRRSIMDADFSARFDPTVGFALDKPTWTMEWVQMKCSTLPASSPGQDAVDVIVFWDVAPPIPTQIPEHSGPHQIKIHTENVKTENRPEPRVLLLSDNTSRVNISSGSDLRLETRHQNLVNCSIRDRRWKLLKHSNLTTDEITSDARVSVNWDNENVTVLVRKAVTADSGLFTLVLQACGRNGSLTFAVNVTEAQAHQEQEVQVQTQTTTTLFAVVTCVVIGASLSFFACILWARRKVCQVGAHQKTIPFSPEPMTWNGTCSQPQTRSRVYDDNYKAMLTAQIIPGSKLSFDEDLLGAGAFGCVSRAQFGSRQVAVKKLKPDKKQDHAICLIEEITILDYLQSEGTHEHVVAMMGVVFDPEIMIVFEFCPLGSLKSFLQTADFIQPTTRVARRIEGCLNENKRYLKLAGDSLSKQRIRLSDLFLYAVQVSKAMEFLQAKGVIHRDIATRNVLVSSASHVKLCDFGLSTTRHSHPNLKYTIDLKALPYKWMSPVSTTSTLSYQN